LAQSRPPAGYVFCMGGFTFRGSQTPAFQRRDGATNRSGRAFG
jgi:hypothetical protein